jgi:hypothetical protein
MKREREEEMKNTRNAPSLFFFEFTNMSTTAGLVYMLSIVAFFGIIFYVLINKLLNKPVDFNQKRKEKLQKRSSGKPASKTTSAKKLE